MTTRRNVIYFVQSGDRGPIKIGIATNATKRLASLQSGNHEELHIRAVLPCSSALEEILHGHFRDFHIRGEWFEAHALKPFIRSIRSGHYPPWMVPYLTTETSKNPISDRLGNAAC